MTTDTEEQTEQEKSSVPAYEAIPFQPWTEGRRKVVNHIIRRLAEQETIFTDFYATCEDHCGECPRCLSRHQRVAEMLTKPDAMVWEVWKFTEESETELPVGILYVTQIRRGADAVAHYVFFDGKLRDKTPLMRRVIKWLFSDHGEDWQALNRLTVQIPEHAFALARAAHKYLGFGGPFEYEHGDTEIEIEGVRRNAYEWKDEPGDMLIMGLLKEQFDGTV